MRALLVLLAGFVVGLGLWINGARQQRAAIAELIAHDQSRVYYDFQCPRVDYLDSPYNWSVTLDPSAESKVPKVIRDIVGDDLFHRVVAIESAGSINMNDLARFRHLKHLAVLSEKEGRLTNEMLSSFARLGGLRSIYIEDGHGLTDSALKSLAKLTKLESLTIKGGDFSDLGLASLDSLRKLRALDLRPLPGQPSSQISDVGVASLSNLKLLEILKLGGDNLTGTACKAIGGLTRLRSVCIASPQVSDEDLQALGTLRSLESLTLERCNIDGSGFTYLAFNARLTRLDVDHCPITDDAVRAIKHVHGLKRAWFLHTQLTAKGLEEFKRCRQLKLLVVGPEAPSGLEALSQMLAPCIIEVRSQ